MLFMDRSEIRFFVLYENSAVRSQTGMKVTHVRSATEMNRPV